MPVNVSYFASQEKYTVFQCVLSLTNNMSDKKRICRFNINRDLLIIGRILKANKKNLILIVYLGWGLSAKTRVLNGHFS